MPAPNTATARDEILARLTAALATPYPDLAVVYDDAVADQPKGEQPAAPDPPVPSGKPWLRVGVRHAGGETASLGSINGKRRFEQSGILFIQMFTPSGDGGKLADPLGDTILDAYRTGGATASGVQFRSARRVEVGKDGAWFLTNCLVDFQYDLIR
jgi:Bacteriophage related domain of unknown function